jgi:hypothetical protein
MWWLALAGCKDDLECPPGFREVNKGCVATETTTTEQALPDLVISPDFLDLGNVDVPCTGERTLEVRNDGEASVDVMSVAFEGQLGDLTLDEGTVPALPLVLEPGDGFTLSFRLEGMETRADQGTLTVTSTDPAGPDTASVSGVVSLVDERTESVVAPLPIADILLLVDTSCSMYADNIDDVTLGIPAMLQALDRSADWQLAVISSDNGCMNIPLVSDASPATANLVVNSIFTYPQHALSEALFAMGAAALNHLDDCNEGMLRPGSQMHFIVVSDEPEQSNTPWQDWIQTFQAYSGTFVVSAVVDEGTVCGYGSDGYLQAAAATSGVVLDVCQSDWGSQLDSVVDAIAEGVVAPIALEDVPLEESLRVSVAGVPVDSFHYNATTNTIEDILPPPRPGQQIDITYGLTGECDG